MISLKVSITINFQHFKIICCSHLQELCLHTKLLAPVNCPIADFLMKAPEPPPALIVRNAVQMLKVGVFIVLFYLFYLKFKHSEDTSYLVLYLKILSQTITYFE